MPAFRFHQHQQMANLAKVVLPMHAVESSPLVRCERPQKGMVHDLNVAPKLPLTCPNTLIHCQNVIGNFRERFLGGNAFGSCSRRSLPSGWQISQPRHQEGRQPVPKRGRGGRGFSRLQTAIENNFRSAIGEGEMLEYVSNAPLPFRMPQKLVLANAFGMVCNQVRQIL